MKSYRILIKFTALTVALFCSVFAFGKNKVHYKSIHWKQLSSTHFSIYFPDKYDTTASIAANWLEKDYSAIANTFNFIHKKRIPVIIFGSTKQFRQTNITDELLPNAVGGFTEHSKNRIVVPFSGNLTEFRHVLNHELVHAFQFALLSNDNSTGFSGASSLRMPLWFAEGLAEYLSLYWNTDADMFMGDLVINQNTTGVENLQGYEVYKAGESFMMFLDNYGGTDKFHKFLQNIKTNKDIEANVKSVYGKKLKELSEIWIKDLKKIYWPEIDRTSTSIEKGINLTEKLNKKTFLNLQPAISHNDSMVAFYSDIDDYTKIVVVDSTGRIIKKIGPFSKFENIEDFEPFVGGGICWSPDNKKIAFVAESHGTDKIKIFNMETGKYEKTVETDFPSITGIDWSLKNQLLFSAQKQFSDLYTYDLKNGKIRRITNNIQFESDAKFSPSGDSVVYTYIDTFSSANPKDLLKTTKSSIFITDLTNYKSKKLLSGRSNFRNPIFTKDGKNIIFISDTNGIDNIYMLNLDSLQLVGYITDLIGGCKSFSLGKEKITASIYSHGKFYIYLLNNFLDNISRGAPKKTKWIKFTEGKDNFFDTLTLAQENTTKDNKDTVKNIVIKHDSLYIIDFLNREKKEYRPFFVPEMGYAGLDYNQFAGFGLGGIIYLSDLMRDQRIAFSGNFLGSFKEFNFFLGYTNIKRRIEYSIGASANRYYSYYSVSYDSLELISSGGATVRFNYPFSKFSRVESNSVLNINKREKYHYNNSGIPEKSKNDAPLKEYIYTQSFSYIFDNVLWGLTGPANGLRSNITISTLPQLGKESPTSYISVTTDIRNYLHIAKKFVWANRLATGFSEGLGGNLNRRKFFLGGDGYWINYSANTKNFINNYNNFYYSSFVEPFRGWNYLDITGTRYALFNTEFRFPFIKEISFVWPIPFSIKYIIGSVFADIGNAWDKEDEQKLIPLPSKIYGGTGFGLSINLSMFILRYDIAWKTDWNTYLKDAKHYISLGAQF